MFGLPASWMAKVSLPYLGFIAVSTTDLIDIPELVGGVSVGGLLIWTIRLAFSQNKSNIADLRSIISELRDENARLRTQLRDKETE